MEDGGPNGEAAVENAAAFDGAELCGGQEVGEQSNIYKITKYEALGIIPVA
jgi:hypothetical protein